MFPNLYQVEKTNLQAEERLERLELLVVTLSGHRIGEVRQLEDKREEEEEAKGMEELPRVRMTLSKKWCSQRYCYKGR